MGLGWHGECQFRFRRGKPEYWEGGMQWFYTEDDKQVGPVSEDELRQLAESGKLSGETMVWREGMPDWQPYGKLDLGHAAPAATDAAGDAACCECGKKFPVNHMILMDDAWVCATCKPIAVQKLREGVGLYKGMRYAGFWIRFAAKFIDGIILQVGGIAMGMVVAMMLGALLVTDGENGAYATIAIAVVNLILQMAMAMAYTTWFVGKFAATPGKMMLKLQVVRPDGERVTYARALGRYFADMLSSMTLMIGYIMAGFDEEKRALHDRICDTRVIMR
jgi:uncharacterized RDD family membrane protein YckC